jgi:hypothetical protein
MCQTVVRIFGRRNEAMDKKNLLLAIILSLLFAFIIGIGLDFPKGRNLTQNDLDLDVNRGALALLVG